MTTLEDSPYSEKLCFEPSLEEQLILPKIHANNLLIIYSTEEALIRLQALVILFYLVQSPSHKTPRILVLIKRNAQQKYQSLLKNHLTQLSTILNGSILPNARKLDYFRYSIIISTPKTAKNDRKEELFPPDHFSLILINQARPTRSLRFLVDQLVDCRILGFTQISNEERLVQLCNNLQLEEVIQLEESLFKRERSNIQHYSVPLPQEYFFILEILDQIRNYEIKELQMLGFSISPKNTYQEVVAVHESLKEENSLKPLNITSNLQRVMTIQRLIISQGFPAVLNYLNSLKLRLEAKEVFQGRKTLVKFLNDLKIQKIQEFIEVHEHLQHPKTQLVLKIITQYQSGISIVTHNYYNAAFLRDFLIQQSYSVIQIDKPISSLSEVKLQRKIFYFLENKTNILITNSINEVIAKSAKVIIAYDVNADTVETLNRLQVDIPKVFLLAKQTNEEARFFYLKRLGSRFQGKNLNSNIINFKIMKTKEITSSAKKSATRTTSYKLNEEKQLLKHTLIFHKQFYETGIPYIFPKEEYSSGISDSISYPGFILDEHICFLLLLPDTVSHLISLDLSKLFKQLSNKFTQVHLVIFVHCLRNLSFAFRCDLFHIANHKKIWISLLDQIDEIPRLVNRVINNSSYKMNFSTEDSS